MLVVVVVVVPTYDEVDNLEPLCRGVRAALPDADLLIVDDASPDGTAARARLVGAEIGGVTVLERSGKTGLGGAYRAGSQRRSNAAPTCACRWTPISPTIRRCCRRWSRSSNSAPTS